MSKIRMSSQVGRVMAGLITGENKHAPATPLPAPEHGAARSIAEDYRRDNSVVGDLARAYLALASHGEADACEACTERRATEQDANGKDVCAFCVGYPTHPAPAAPSPAELDAAVQFTAWLIAQREDARNKVREWTDAPPEQGNPVEQVGYWRGFDHALGLVMARRVNHRPAPAARVTPVAEAAMVLRGARAIADLAGFTKIGWENLEAAYRDEFLNQSRAILTAALSEATNA